MRSKTDVADLAEPPIQTVRDAEETLRGFVSGPPRQPVLLADMRRWNMICAALDVIGDTEAALNAYLEAPEAGNPYLTAYGVLQALYLQQDAVRDVFGALDIPFSLSDAVRVVRKVRNETVGHPTSIRGKAFVIIVQLTVDHYGFEYNHETAAGTLTTHHVELRALIESQRTEMVDVLKALCEDLRLEWHAYMNDHSKTKLVALLPKTWSYHVSNLWRPLENAGAVVVGQVDIQMLLEPVVRIEQELLSRSEPLEGLDWSLPRLRHALERLQEIFAGRAPTFGQRDAEIFITFVREQMKRLQKHLTHLDEEYEEASQE